MTPTKFNASVIHPRTLPPPNEHRRVIGGGHALILAVHARIRHTSRACGPRVGDRYDRDTDRIGAGDPAGLVNLPLRCPARSECKERLSFDSEPQYGRQEPWKVFLEFRSKRNEAPSARRSTPDDTGFTESLHMVTQSRFGDGGIKIRLEVLLPVSENHDNAEANGISECR